MAENRHGVSQCKLSETIKEVDIFGESFTMKLEGNKSAYRSYMGAFCSFIVFIFLAAFTITKLQTLLLIEEVDVMSASEDHVLDPGERFSSEDGFFIAAAITAYDGDPEPDEKPEYGELFIEHYGWGNEEIGFEYGSTRIPNHQCSDSDLSMT